MTDWRPPSRPAARRLAWIAASGSVLIEPSPPARRNASAIRATHRASISLYSMNVPKPASIEWMSSTPHSVPDWKSA